MPVTARFGKPGQGVSGLQKSKHRCKWKISQWKLSLIHIVLAHICSIDQFSPLFSCTTAQSTFNLAWIVHLVKKL